jgi:hypothetical protein
MKTSLVSGDIYGGRSPRDIPAYTAAEAAHYLRVPENTIRAWVYGRAYPTVAGRRRTRPVVTAADAVRGLSFTNLLELHVLGAIRRRHHVDMKHVRSAVDFLKREFGTEHPLVDEVMDTDGKHLFVRKYGGLINALRQGQGAMTELLEAHLRRSSGTNTGWRSGFSRSPAKVSMRRGWCPSTRGSRSAGR